MTANAAGRIQLIGRLSSRIVLWEEVVFGSPCDYIVFYHHCHRQRHSSRTDERAIHSQLQGVFPEKRTVSLPPQ